METNPKLYLTFDDGPSPATPIILDILKQYGVQATFFMCGKNIERYPEIARRVEKENHAIGNHSYSHSFLKTVTGYGMARELAYTHAAIAKIIGKTSSSCRTPWGILNPKTKRAARQLRYNLYRWDASAVDWQQPFISYASMKRHLLSQIKPDSIILLHDGRSTSRYVFRSKTVKLVAELIPYLLKQGYVFKPLP